MKHIKKNWQVVVVSFVLVFVAGSMWWHVSTNSTAIAQVQEPSEYPSVTPYEKEAVFNTLDQIHLDREALIALNVNDTQAENILSTTRTWLATNQTNLSVAKTAIDEKAAEVRYWLKAIRTNSDAANASLRLAQAKTELNAAKAAYEGQLSPLRSMMTAQMSETQIATWAAIENGWDKGMPLRMLNLTTQQKQALGKIMRHDRLLYAQAVGAGSQTELMAQAQSAATVDPLASILGDNNQQIMNAYAEYAEQAAEALANAEETVLPISEEPTA